MVNYKDPRWQRRRLEILESRGWECESCGAKDQTLEVHHCFYEWPWKNEIWDYPDNCFLVLCEDHHEEWHRKKLELDKLCAGFFSGDLDKAIGLLRGLRCQAVGDDVLLNREMDVLEIHAIVRGFWFCSAFHDAIIAECIDELRYREEVSLLEVVRMVVPAKGRFSFVHALEARDV